MSRPTFYHRVIKHFEDFFIRMEKRIFSYIESMFDWAGSVAADLADELKVYFIVIVVSGLSAAVFFSQESLPLAESKRGFLVSLAIVVLIGSGFLVSYLVVTSLLRKAGLLVSAAKIVKGLFKKIGIRIEPKRPPVKRDRQKNKKRSPVNKAKS